MSEQQRYRVLERIAAGGMAEVFRAESAGLEGFKKKVAIKRVLPHLAEKDEFIGMFLDEARLSAHLNHSNCVQVFDIGQGDNTYFIVMEMVDGADLKAIIEHQRKSGHVFPVEEACLICVRVCEGLSYAHELHDEHGQHLKIVHRDISPPNVLITRYGEVKVVDFGLAKANSSLEDSQPGIIKGKFGYLSPEAAQGKAVDQRTDIFAVGIMLWEMLAGRRLFQGKTDLQTVKMIQKADVPDIRQFNPHVPESVAAVIARSLAGDPAQRYQSARQFGYDLNQVLFELPRAVSSFDIAQMVSPVKEEKARESAANEASFIGSLIDQALFQFTSLKDGSEGGGEGNASPLDVHSFAGPMPTAGNAESMDWGTDLSLSSPPSAAGAPDGSEPLELGNLSALEDAADRPQVPSSLPELPSEASASGGKGGLWIALSLLLLLGGTAAAYFTGSIPPSLLKSLGL